MDEKRTEPGYRKEAAVLGGNLQTGTLTDLPWDGRKTGIGVVGSPAGGSVLGDEIREGGVVRYGRGGVIDAKLKGNGHTCVG